MKTKIAVIVIISSFNQITQSQTLYGNRSEGQSIANAADAELNKMRGIYAQQAAEQEEQARLSENLKTEWSVIYKCDPWRVVNGQTNSTRGKGWYELQGKVKEVMEDGVLLQGNYGNVLTIRPEQSDPSSEVKYGTETFFVKNFPTAAEKGDAFCYMLGYANEDYVYTNRMKKIIKYKQFDYGIPCAKIWSAEEIEAQKKILAEAKKNADSKKQAIADKILKNNQDLADKGDVYGLMRMGERYRDGEGVETNLTKARIYLTKAAEAGSEKAKSELERLPAK